jgi:hypothetical protein
MRGLNTPDLTGVIFAGNLGVNSLVVTAGTRYPFSIAGDGLLVFDGNGLGQLLGRQ